jgi:hypothetical protein
MTDTPRPVEAGHLQLEMGLFSYSLPHLGGVPPEALDLLDLVVKVGIARGLDLELGYHPLLLERGGEGFSADVGASLSLRSKIMLLGHSGPIALTLAPVLLIPVRAGGGVEGGGLVLFSVPLPGELWLDLDLGAFAQRDGGSYRWLVTPMIGLTRVLVGRLQGYVELYSELYRDTAVRWGRVLGVGLLLPVTRDVQLDGGANFGLSDDAAPCTLFLGVAARL